MAGRPEKKPFNSLHICDQDEKVVMTIQTYKKILIYDGGHWALLLYEPEHHFKLQRGPATKTEPFTITEDETFVILMTTQPLLLRVNSD